MKRYKRKIDGIPTKEYRAWKAMKARCYSPCNKKMGKYQAMNIQVCDRWLNSFENFMDDMGFSPSKDHSLDRIDPKKGYTPENCRWATWKTQSSNRGDFNLIYEHKGKSMILKDWAKKLNIKYTTLYQRIFRSKMSFEEAINYSK